MKTLFQAYDNPEDAAKLGVEPREHPDVQRVKRAHMNDLENIIPMIIIGFFFVLSDPEEISSLILFRVAGVARILHSIFHAAYPVGPIRSISYVVALLISVYMIFYTLINNFFYI